MARIWYDPGKCPLIITPEKTAANLAVWSLKQKISYENAAETKNVILDYVRTVFIQLLR